MSVGKRLKTLLVFFNFEWHGQNKVGNNAIPVLWRDREKLYGRFCPIRLIHLTGRKSLHLEKKLE